MISVLIPTFNSERVLVPVLSALVPGSAAGILREVMLVDGGSSDGTGRIADAAGCVFLKGKGSDGERLKAGAAASRGDWLLFLEPGSVLDEGWQREVTGFMETVERTGQTMNRAAVFRLAIDGFGVGPRFRETIASLNHLWFSPPSPEQGLLISKKLYDSLGGHEPIGNTRGRLLWRVGRSRIVTLRTRAVVAQA